MPHSSRIPVGYGVSLEATYDQAFYEGQMAESLQSARIYIAHLHKYLQPSSVLDVGCGRGMWLKACGELGSTKLIGLDGGWNRPELMVEPTISFRPIDLDQPFTEPRVDLAMCLEVAEHLAPASAATFVTSLGSTSDVVLFGAALLGQGGTNHINEQPASYWAALFDKQGFDAFDLFRPTLWGDKRVCFWYRQNTFLYARRDSAVHRRLPSPVSRGFMDCVHPELFANTVVAKQYVDATPSFSENVAALAPSFVRAVKRRLR